MPQWLVTVLRGPLASFADAPGNTTRKTGDMPTRSALIGFAAAALGIRREDANGQSALSSAIVTAAAQIEPGTLLTDFHTFQSLHQSAKGALTRADALSRREYVETAITRRDYRADALWQGAYRLSNGATSLTLEALAAAFRRPHFFLSLGRRSCALSHPLDPRIIEAGDVRDAFAAHLAESGTDRLRNLRAGTYSLEDISDAPGANGRSEHRRRDDPRDRSIRWTFAERREWRLIQEAAEELGP